ncbi:hypothetical protein [Leptospira alexanderi]|nr:hypothetical protein [Leptospira alexanderi]
MTQQRNDYIAEKILGANKKIQYGKTWLYVPDKEFEPPFEWEFPSLGIVI